jgi:SAM-dependent methyltransferase
LLLAKDVKDGLSDKSIYSLYDDVVLNFGNGSVFVELGCFTGQSTIYLAQSIKNRNKKQQIYAVDTWQNMIGPGIEGSIFYVFWDNVIKAEVEQFIRPVMLDSSRAAQAFADRSVDFVYVDADHSFLKCWDDIVSWLPKLKIGGWMGGHDYNQNVEKCVNRIFGKTNVQNLSGGAASWLVKFNG